MIRVSRFFDRASGRSVFVLSNCYVEQTPPLGQSDKCRDRLASTSLSSLLNHTPPPLPGPPPTSHGAATSHPPWPLLLKWTFTERCPLGFFQVSTARLWLILPKSWIRPPKVQAKSFPWQALSSPFKWSWTERLNFCQLELFPPLLNHWKTTCLPCLSPSHLSFIF